MLQVFKNARLALFVTAFSLFVSVLSSADLAFAQSASEKVEQAEHAMIADDLKRFLSVIEEIAGNKDTISQLKASAESGDARAGLYYAIIMINAGDTSTSQEIGKVMPYLKRASDNDVKFSNFFLLIALSEIDSDPDEFDDYLRKGAEKGDIPTVLSDTIRETVSSINQRDEALASAGREEIELKARQGSVRRQIFLAERYSEGGDGRFPRNVSKALEWAQMASRVDKDALGYMEADIESAYADELPNPAQLLIAQFIHHSEVAKLMALQQSVDACQTPACAFQKVWAYADVSGDDALTVAELARLQRNMVKLAVSKNAEMESAEELLALHGALVLILPMGASAVMNSFDYDGNGKLSLDEVAGEDAMAVLAGISAGSGDDGLDFAALGERLRSAVSSLPLPF